jgi:hypothetical protein
MGSSPLFAACKVVLRYLWMGRSGVSAHDVGVRIVVELVERDCVRALARIVQSECE